MTTYFYFIIIIVLKIELNVFKTMWKLQCFATWGCPTQHASHSLL